jgi:hypothetical protein
MLCETPSLTYNIRIGFQTRLNEGSKHGCFSKPLQEQSDTFTSNSFNEGFSLEHKKSSYNKNGK